MEVETLSIGHLLTGLWQELCRRHQAVAFSEVPSMAVPSTCCQCFVARHLVGVAFERAFPDMVALDCQANVASVALPDPTGAATASGST